VIHRGLLPQLPALMREMGERHGVEVFADEDAWAALTGHYAGPLNKAREEHFGQEFLSLKLSVKSVSGLDEALDLGVAPHLGHPPGPNPEGLCPVAPVGHHHCPCGSLDVCSTGLRLEGRTPAAVARSE
jgi:hypothetical protein